MVTVLKLKVRILFWNRMCGIWAQAWSFSAFTVTLTVREHSKLSVGCTDSEKQSNLVGAVSDQSHLCVDFISLLEDLTVQWPSFANRNLLEVIH